MARPPDLIVSGINSGSNAGINVLYSGTVAAAIEGAFFKITSIAVSLELSEHFDFPHAAKQAVRVIEKILAHKPPNGSLFNVNLPAHSRGEPKGIRVVPMGLGRYGEGFERRQDPRGRTYYWLTYNPPYNVSRAGDRRLQPLRRLHHGHPVALRPDPPRPDPRGQPVEMGRVIPPACSRRPANRPDEHLEPGENPMHPRSQCAFSCCDLRHLSVLTILSAPGSLCWL